MEFKKKNRTWIDSVKDCLRGISYTFKTENNFKREILLGIIVIICGFFLKLSLIEWVIIILLINTVLVGELINTALERTVDLYTKEYNEIARAIKDAASGSVLVICTSSAIIGLLIFLPKIINLLEEIKWKTN